MRETNPQGVIVIIKDPSGRVVATSENFQKFTRGSLTTYLSDPDAPKPPHEKRWELFGLAPQEAQEYRASETAWQEVVRSGCEKQLAEAIVSSLLDVRSIREQLTALGWTQTVLPIYRVEGTAPGQSTVASLSPSTC